MILQWKEYSVNLEKVEDALKAMLGADYIGSSGIGAGSTTHAEGLHLHLSENVTDGQKSDIQDYWDAITEESEEATAYQSNAEIEAIKATKKAEGKAALIALGLTEDQVNAMIG